MKKNKIYTLIILLIFGINAQAQNSDLKYLDDDGYSEIRNLISIDLVQLLTPAISIKYDRLFGGLGMVSVGIKILNPNRDQKFYVDFNDFYNQNNRLYNAKSPGINYFVELKLRNEFGNSYFIPGIGYRNQRYETADFHDIYITAARVFEIGTRLFISVGLEAGVRLMRFNDVVYNPDGATGLLLAEYDRRYEEAKKTGIPIIRPNISLGYMF